MDTCRLKDMIAVIRAEQQRRGTLRRETQSTLEDTSFEYDQWLFIDAPFVNELCLMVLVTLRHQVERELIKLAALAADDGKEISGQQYQEKAREVRELLRKHGWKTINDRLSLESCGGHTSMEALRLLANSYKHHPSMEPDNDLLKLLKLETGVNYLSLPESASLQEGLAVCVGFGSDAAYCDIAERFVDIAGDFLADVQSRTKVSPVKFCPTSFNPDIAAG